MQAESLDFSKERLTVTSGQEFPVLARMLYDVAVKQGQGYNGSFSCLGSLLVQLAADTVAENYRYPFVRDIRDFLAQNFENPDITMDTLSGLFGYNGDYIRRCFKTDMGVTPLMYLCSLRIRRAGDMLLGLRFYTVEEVAKQCGFSDPYYFSRCFKKQTGVSPSRFRSEGGNAGHPLVD